MIRFWKENAAWATIFVKPLQYAAKGVCLCCKVLSLRLDRHSPEHLPNGTDINKQITYGEYFENARGLPDEKLFNMFLIPYNAEENGFGIGGKIENVGEAVGDWRTSKKL